MCIKSIRGFLLIKLFVSRLCHTFTKYVVLLFLLNLLVWHWLIQLCRFQVYIAMIYDLYVASSAHHSNAHHLPSPCIRPPLCLLPLHPPFLWYPPYCFLCMSFCLLVFLVYSFVAFSFMFHIWMKSYGSSLFLPDYSQVLSF